MLLVCDEEWRIAPFAHTARFGGYDACLCFEAGEISEDGEDGVIVRRKGAGTMRVRATGRASHSGSAPQQGVTRCSRSRTRRSRAQLRPTRTDRPS